MRALNDFDRAEISRKVAEGFTSGIIDMDGRRIYWKIEAEKFDIN